MKFCSGGILAATRVKMSDSEKKKCEQEHARHLKHVTRKFLDVSRCSRAKQRQRNVQKRCAARVKLLVC